MDNSIILKAADNVRILSAAMVEKAKSGHPGGAMGAATAITLLFAEFLRFDPKNPQWEARDRFLMDPGHMSPLLYAELVLTGRLSLEDLKNFRQFGSITSGHPELSVEHGIENSSGPLGLGQGMAAGVAIAERYKVAQFGDIVSHKTVALVSDGGIQEEIAYGIGRIAGHLKLSNLIFFYDANGVQLSCKTSDVMDQDFKKQYESWGWRVLEADGENVDELRQAFKAAFAEKERPTIVIGHTTMAKGAVGASGESFEGKVSTHGQPLSGAGASTEETIRHLGGNAENPFEIFPEVKAAFDSRLQELEKIAADWNAKKADWDSKNPEKAATLRSWLAGKSVKLDLKDLAQKDGEATRNSSGTVLSYLAKNYRNIICSSADLSNSDQTQKFLNETRIMTPGDFGGAFVQVGVAELSMGAIACGLALSGGLYPICATFFVFSDFMKPVIRMAALQGLPVKYVFTHDSFRVGEDGPTHQPIEHETQLRLLEDLVKEDGRPQMLVLRPADAAETTVAWEMAFENEDSPTALILTRQKVGALPVPQGTSRYAEAAKCRRGAYIVSDNTPSGKNPDLTFVANGSDVLLCHDAAEILRGEGKNVRVVSMISPKLFLIQDAAYRESVIVPWTPVYALSSGLPVLFKDVVGGFGKVAGLERFGASAPASVLEKKFGYEPESVAKNARKYLAEFAQNIAAFKKVNG